MTTNSRTRTKAAHPNLKSTTSQLSNNYQAASVPIALYGQVSGELEAAKQEIAALSQENQQLWQQNQYLAQELNQAINSAQYLKQIVANFDLGVNIANNQPFAAQNPQYSVTSPRSNLSHHLPPRHQDTKRNFANSPLKGQQTPQVNQVNRSESKSVPTDFSDESLQQASPQVSSNVITEQSPITHIESESSLVVSSNSENSQLATITPELVLSQDPNSYQNEKNEPSSRMNMWLLTIAIILIVFTAFGTGFMIVRPLLNQGNSR